MVPRTVRGRREVSSPAKYPLERSAKFFLGLRGAHLGGRQRGAVPSAGVPRLAPGSLEKRRDSAGDAPSRRAGVWAVLVVPRRRAPLTESPPQGAAPASTPTPSQAGGGVGAQKGFVRSGVESAQAPLPPPPLLWAQCRHRAPAGAEQTSGNLVYAGPRPLAEQNARSSTQVPANLLRFSSPAHPSLGPPPSPQWCLRPFPFLSLLPESLVPPVSLPSLQTPPRSFVFLPAPRVPFCSG